MTGDNTPPPAEWYDPGPVKPRRIDPNPRCHSCQTGPMFHPLHKWSACQVRLPGGELCGCIAGVVPSPPAA